MGERPSDGSRTELRCGLLVDGSGGPPREDMSVVLEGGLVSSVEPWRQRDARRRDDVVDVSDATVTPGLIDAHAHLCWGSPHSRAWTGLPADNPASVVAWGLASCSAALAGGVTTVVDCGSPAGLALTVRDLLRSGVASGPRVLAAGPAITTSGGHGEFIGTTADTAAEVRTAVRQVIRSGADLVKIMVTGGATDPHTNRRQPQYGDEEILVAVTDAHRLGRLVVGHANATSGIVSAVRAGIDVVAHCNWLGPEPGTVVLDMPTVEVMARRGTYVDLNVQGARRSGDTDGQPQAWPDHLPMPRNRWELLAPLRAARVPLYLSSDAFGPAIGSFAADLAQASAEWAVSIEDLVCAVTSVPARAFGLDRRGVVATGYDGDLTVFGGDLRSDTSGLGRPRAVFQQGRLTVDNGRLAPPRVAQEHADETQAQLRLIDEVLHGLG